MIDTNDFNSVLDAIRRYDYNTYASLQSLYTYLKNIKVKRSVYGTIDAAADKVERFAKEILLNLIQNEQEVSGDYSPETNKTIYNLKESLEKEFDAARQQL